MKTLFLLLVALLCSFAAPPGAFATASTPAVKAVAIYKLVRATQAAVAVVVAESPVAARIVAVESPAPLPSADIDANAERSGATKAVYLSTVGPVLRVRPGWRGSFDSAYTRYKAAEFRYS